MSKASRHEKAPSATTLEASGNEFHYQEENVMTNSTANTVDRNVQASTVINLRDFVDARDGQARTTSIKVAEAFGKQHQHVTQKVEALECSEQFLTSNFSLVNYKHRGNTYKSYEMTKDGFMFLVMGFTGAKAASVKEGYIAAFNWMAGQLGSSGSEILDTVLGSTIGTNGFNMLGALIKGKVVGLPSASRHQATMKIWSQTHTAFGVRSAQDIPASQLDAARNFIAAYALEGEWLGKEPAASVDQPTLGNMAALHKHAQAIRAIYVRYDLYRHFTNVGSPVAAELHDHVTAAACLSAALLARLSDMPAVRLVGSAAA